MNPLGRQNVFVRSYLDGKVIHESLQRLAVYLKEDGTFYVGPWQRPQPIQRLDKPFNFHGVKCPYLWEFHANTVAQTTTTTGEAA